MEFVYREGPVNLSLLWGNSPCVYSHKYFKPLLTNHCLWSWSANWETCCFVALPFLLRSLLLPSTFSFSHGFRPVTNSELCSLGFIQILFSVLLFCMLLTLHPHLFSISFNLLFFQARCLLFLLITLGFIVI